VINSIEGSGFSFNCDCSIDAVSDGRSITTPPPNDSILPDMDLDSIYMAILVLLILIFSIVCIVLAIYVLRKVRASRAGSPTKKVMKQKIISVPNEGDFAQLSHSGKLELTDPAPNPNLETEKNMNHSQLVPEMTSNFDDTSFVVSLSPLGKSPFESKANSTREEEF